MKKPRQGNTAAPDGSSGSTKPFYPRGKEADCGCAMKRAGRPGRNAAPLACGQAFHGLARSARPLPAASRFILECHPMIQPCPALPIGALVGCLMLGACASHAGGKSEARQITGLLLEHGRPAADVRIEITSSRFPGKTTLTRTDSAGRFGIGTKADLGLVGASPPTGDVVLRIEAIGSDYLASGEIAPTSALITCDLSAAAPRTLKHQASFRDGNDTQASLLRSSRALLCK